MTLTTHAVAGAALASFMPEHSAVAFCAGFASHMALDRIPHWDKYIFSPSLDPRVHTRLVYNWQLFVDFSRISIDCTLGILLSLLFFASSSTLLTIMCGVVGALLPDALHFVYSRMPREPLATFERFHIAIQRNVFSSRPLAGILSQVAWVAGIIVSAQYIHTYF